MSCCNDCPFSFLRFIKGSSLEKGTTSDYFTVAADPNLCPVFQKTKKVKKSMPGIRSFTLFCSSINKVHILLNDFSECMSMVDQREMIVYLCKKSRCKVWFLNLIWSILCFGIRTLYENAGNVIMNKNRKNSLSFLPLCIVSFHVSNIHLKFLFLFR